MENLAKECLIRVQPMQVAQPPEAVKSAFHRFLVMVVLTIVQ